MLRRFEYPELGETLYRETLPNGLRLSIVPKPDFTGASACLAVKYGSADRRFFRGTRLEKTPMGSAHYLEHKLFDLPDGEDAMALMSANGAQANASTDTDITSYYFYAAEKFEENLNTLLRMIATPYFTEESVAKEREIILQEIRMDADDPYQTVYENLLRCLYASHPLRDPIAGTEDSIRTITPRLLYRCHRSFYIPSNMALAVAGDVNPRAVRAAALSLLPREPGTPPRRDYGAPETLVPCESRRVWEMEVSAPLFLLGAKLRSEEAGEALLRQELVGGLAVQLLWGSASPFYHRLYDSGLLNTDFCADLEWAAGTLTLYAGGESREPEAVLDAFLAEAETAAKQGFEPDYFSRILRSRYGLRLRAMDSLSALSASLAEWDLDGCNVFDSFSMESELTQEDVLAFIREQLRRADFALSVINPKKDRKEGENSVDA